MDPTNKEMADSMRRLVDRLAGLGWIQKSFVSEGGFHIELTSRGRSELGQLGDLLQRIRWPVNKADLMCLYDLCCLAQTEDSSAGGLNPAQPGSR
jgi:hypothetical protein